MTNFQFQPFLFNPTGKAQKRKKGILELTCEVLESLEDRCRQPLNQEHYLQNFTIRDFLDGARTETLGGSEIVVLYTIAKGIYTVHLRQLPFLELAFSDELKKMHCRGRHTTELQTRLGSTLDAYLRRLVCRA